jgi:hypothetical protein
VSKQKNENFKQCRTALLCAGAHGNDLDLFRWDAGQFAELEAEGELRGGCAGGSGDGVDNQSVRGKTRCGENTLRVLFHEEKQWILFG